MKKNISYRHHQNFVKVVYVVLITVSCLAVGFIISLLHQAHPLVMANTNRNLIELSQSISTSLEEKFEEIWMSLESVAMTCGQANTLSPDDLDRLQKQAEQLQFEYFALLSPDGFAICSDGAFRTFGQQDEVMKAFEGQPVIDVNVQEEAIHAENKNMLLLAVPIYSDKEANEISGILAASILPQWADSILTQTYYGGNIFFNVIKADGTEVLTEYPYAPQFDEQQDSGDRNNLFDTLDANIKEIIGDITVDDIREAAAAGQSEVIRFRLLYDELIHVAFLRRIGDTDLCVWMIDANDAASGGLDQLLHKAFLANGIGVICFGALIISLIFLYQNNMRLLMVDPVVGGYSLFRFNQEAERLIHRSDSDKYAFVTMNIANFKLFNDIYGHDQSDRVLKHVHDTIHKCTEEDEILARSNEDMFNLLLHTTIKEVITQRLDIIIDEINRFNDALPEKQCIMFRIGVYQIADTSLSIIQIRDRANIARKKQAIPPGDTLYSCAFYESEDLALLQQENILTYKMKDALKNKDFKVYLQPKVDISTGDIVGAEALVRWKDANMGFIPPDEFISLFEKNGFIRQLDLYMFEQVCICLRGWLDAGLQPVPISVNLSRVHLANKDFLEPFIKVQGKYSIPSEFLEFELTETAVQDDPDALAEAVHRIHLANYTCSLDDFGSGYSSLNSLELLDIDVLKLDYKFLRAAKVKNDKGHIIIKELIHMARQLGIAVCCEGVETEAQLSFLQECCCDKGQGDLFSKPVEVSAFEQMLFGNTINKATNLCQETKEMQVKQIVTLLMAGKMLFYNLFKF